MVPLAELLPAAALEGLEPALLRRLLRPCADSRLVQAGDCFFALTAAGPDRNAHLAEAVRRGAAVVVVAGQASSCPVPLLVVDDVRAVHARACYRWHGLTPLHPALLGVTGTDGKTSVSWLTWRCLGAGAARVGTLGLHDGHSEQASAHTTPPPEILAPWLASLPADCPGVAIELSSHAAVQRRLGEQRLRALALTGIGRDHLDYHADQAAYRDAKLTWIDCVADQGLVLCNADDANAALVTERAARRGLQVHGLGFTAGDYRIEGTAGAWRLRGAELDLALPGDRPAAFNAWNAAAAVILAASLGVAAAVSGARLAADRGVPGRLERVLDTPLGYVDFAHTPEAIARVLQALREAHPGRQLVCVFGCGGDRDRGKRGPMARAALYADEVVLTADNPRSEGQEAIAADLLAQLTPGEAARIRREDDRGSAIAYGLELAGADGVLAVLGKGAETEQILPDGRVAWDDRSALRRLGGARS